MSRKVSNPRVTAPIEDVDLPLDRHPARRFLIASLTLLILVISLRAVWGAIGDRRWRAARVELQRQEMLSPVARPIASSTSPESEAAFYLLRAGRAAELSEAEWGSIKDIDPLAPNPSSRDLAVLGRILETRPEILADIHRARAAGEIRWPSSDLVEPDDFQGLQNLNRLRNLDTVLQYSVTRDHGVGDDAAAVDRLRDMLYVSRAAGRLPGSVSFFLACGMGEMAVDSLDEVCLTLHINGMRDSASPAEVKSLIGDLLDEDGFRNRIVEAIRADSDGTIEWVERCREGRQSKITGQVVVNGQLLMTRGPRWANVLASKIAGPYYSFQGAKDLRYNAARMEALRASDYPSVLRRLPPPPAREERDYLFGADWVVRDFSTGSGDAWIRICFETCAARRLAAAQLAIRWYTRDHSGWLPASLDLLVPKYLPSVPEDIWRGPEPASGTCPPPHSHLFTV